MTESVLSGREWTLPARYVLALVVAVLALVGVLAR